MRGCTEVGEGNVWAGHELDGVRGFSHLKNRMNGTHKSDIVEFKFEPKNHTGMITSVQAIWFLMRSGGSLVTQSSFDYPCMKL